MLSFELRERAGEGVAAFGGGGQAMRRTEHSNLGLATLGLAKSGLAKFGFAVLVAAGTAGLMAPCGFAQDAQPSVADAARAAAAAKKDKEKNAAKTVITDDSLGSGAMATSKASGAGAAGTAQGSASGAAAASGDAGGGGMSSASLDSAWERLQATEASLDRLEPLGKSEVATTVLGGNSADFPGRAEWEEKMYAEKTAYCARSRQLIQAMKEALLRMAEMNSGNQKVTSSNDPRVVSLTRKTTQLMQLAQKTEAEFQGVVSEGRSLEHAGK
jgi:hypothetical protein